MVIVCLQLNLGVRRTDPATTFRLVLNMEPPSREYAATGLGLIVFAWVWVCAVEILASPAKFVMPVLRLAGVMLLAAAVLKGNRAASIVLLIWSIVGMLLGGFMGALLVLTAGVILFLAVGGHKAFRPPAASDENGSAPLH